MIKGKPIFVKMGDEWIPATEVDVTVKVGGVNIKDFYRVWDFKTLNLLLNSAIEKEYYEQANVINEAIKTKKK